MKRTKWWLSPTAAMALSLLAAWAAPDGRPPTVADFSLKVSRAMGQRPADQTAAVKALRKTGVDLGEDVSANLTMGRAARILRDLGLQVTDPQDPAGQVSSARADQIIKAVGRISGKFSRLLFTRNARNSRNDCPVSPADPEDCPGDDDDDDDDDHDDDGDDDHDDDHDDDGDHDDGDDDDDEDD